MTYPYSRGPRTVSDVPMAEAAWRYAVTRGYVVVGDEDSCWQWLAYINQAGYGALRHKYKSPARAHVVAYVAHHGELVPEGLVLDHTCGNRACVNPSHLEPVTQWVNTFRGKSPMAAQLLRTNCPRGHALAGDNLNQSQLRRGKRVCRACSRERNAERNAMVRAAARALGMTHLEYTSTHGNSKRAALQVLARESVNDYRIPQDGDDQ